jgi:hypothetical protein
MLNGIKSNAKRYQQIHDDVASWEMFDTVDPGDAVYRVPLSLMP